MKLNGRFIVFDANGQPHNLRDLASLCRHAQTRHAPALPAYELDLATRRPELVILRRDGHQWRLRAMPTIEFPDGMLIDSHEVTSLTDPRAGEAVDLLEQMAPTVACHPIPIALWNCAGFEPYGAAEARLHPLGYHEPRLVGAAIMDPGAWRWEYCPERIAETATHLNDAEFSAYVSYIHLRARMRTNAAPELDDATFQAMVDDATYNAGRGFSPIVSSVEMRVLEGRV